MAKKGKFEKLGKNDAYYDTHEDKTEGKKKREKPLKAAEEKAANPKSGILNLNPKSVPEKQKESGKFTFSTDKKVSIYTEKTTPPAEKPDKAPFVLALCVFALQFLSMLFLCLADLSVTGVHIAKSLLYIGIYIIPVLVYIMSKSERKKKYNICGFSPSYLTFTFASLALLLSVTALQKYYIAYTFTYSEDMGAMGVNTFLVVISGAILPAICEEIFVHGVFQHEVSKYGGGFAGIIASSFVFAMLHFELQYFVIYLVSAFILGSLTHVTGSCVPAIIVHMINNMAAIFVSDRMAYVAKERIGGTLLMIVLTLLSFAFLIILLRMAQHISEGRAMTAEGAKKGQDSQGDFLVSKEGRSFERIIKALTSPAFLACVAIFIIGVAALSQMGA